jgi:hypothetical protein
MQGILTSFADQGDQGDSERNPTNGFYLGNKGGMHEEKTMTCMIPKEL